MKKLAALSCLALLFFPLITHANVIFPFYFIYTKGSHILFNGWWMALGIFVEFLLIKKLLPNKNTFLIAGAIVAANTASALIGTLFLMLGDVIFYLVPVNVITSFVDPSTMIFEYVLYPLWYLCVTTFANTLIEAPILWLFLMRTHPGKVSAKQFISYVAFANLLSNGLLLFGIGGYDYFYGQIPVRF